MKVHNTGIKQKEEHWQRFADLIGNQFKHGGDKYSFNGRTDKEFTDFVCELAPGKTGFDWIFQTQLKYMGRFMNFNREKDLLKIATYCYIAWLKAGFHLTEEHDEDTEVNGVHLNEIENAEKEEWPEPDDGYVANLEFDKAAEEHFEGEFEHEYVHEADVSALGDEKPESVPVSWQEQRDRKEADAS